MADLELPRATALAWGLAAEPVRGPKREMSIERIVEAAVELADADGIGAVSMSSVAARLGYTTMSLYRYVSAKDDLLVLMAEEGVGLPPDHDPIDDDWRRGLQRWADALIAAYLRHPWLLDIPIDGVPLNPNDLAWLDWGLRILAPTPLTRDEGVSAVLMLSGLTRWQAGLTRVLTQSDRPPDYDQQVLRQLVDPDNLPEVHAAVLEGVFGPEGDDNDPFAFALARGLDGLELYMERMSREGDPPRAGRPSRPRPPTTRTTRAMPSSNGRPGTGATPNASCGSSADARPSSSAGPGSEPGGDRPEAPFGSASGQRNVTFLSVDHGGRAADIPGAGGRSPDRKISIAVPVVVRRHRLVGRGAVARRS